MIYDILGKYTKLDCFETKTLVVVFCRMSGLSPCLHKLVMLFFDAASCSKYKLQIGLDPSTFQGGRDRSLQCTSFSFYQKFVLVNTIFSC